MTSFVAYILNINLIRYLRRTSTFRGYFVGDHYAQLLLEALTMVINVGLFNQIKMFAKIEAFNKTVYH